MICLFAAEECHAKRDRLGAPLKVLAIVLAALAKAVDAKLVIGDSGCGGRSLYSRLPCAFSKWWRNVSE